jgi:hypothetical protein
MKMFCLTLLSAVAWPRELRQSRPIVAYNCPG